MDATVLAPALIEGLFDRLPPGGHELVLFDINRVAQIESLLKWSPAQMFEALQSNHGLTFTLGVVANKNSESLGVMFSRKQPGAAETVDTDLGLNWPRGVYSLSHVALPFHPEDPLYGGEDHAKSPGIHLGNLALRGEKGALLIPAAEMLRLRWNPFYPFVEQKVLEFLKLEDAAAAK